MYNINYNDTKILNNKTRKIIAKNLDTLIEQKGDCKGIACIACNSCPISSMVKRKGFSGCVAFIKENSRGVTNYIEEILILCYEIKNAKEKRN